MWSIHDQLHTCSEVMQLASYLVRLKGDHEGYVHVLGGNISHSPEVQL